MLLSLLQRLERWWLIRFSRNMRVDGLWVGSSRDNAGALSRVQDALAIIKAHDPYRYKRVLREFDRLLVHLLPGVVGAFRPRLRWCVLDERFVLSSPVEHIASTIVHEATHGLLGRHNIGYPENLRPRIERVCMRQELAFARKLPNGDELSRSTELRLGRPLPSLTNESCRNRNLKGEIEMARHAGIPDWVIRALLGFRKRFVSPHHLPQ